MIALASSFLDDIKSGEECTEALVGRTADGPEAAPLAVGTEGSVRTCGDMRYF